MTLFVDSTSPRPATGRGLLFAAGFPDQAECRSSVRGVWRELPAQNGERYSHMATQFVSRLDRIGDS
jgi:hypothetical protein